MADKLSDDSGIHSSTVLIPLYFYCVNMSHTAQTVVVMRCRTKSELSSFIVLLTKIKEHIEMSCIIIPTAVCLVPFYSKPVPLAVSQASGNCVG